MTKSNVLAQWTLDELEEEKSLLNLQPETVSDQQAIRMPVAVLFQDDATLACAGSLCRRLARQHGPENFLSTEWSFTALANPESFDRATVSAISSEVVVVALRHADPLPAPVKVWLERWAEGRIGGAGALVALFAGTESASRGNAAADKELRLLAQNGCLDYYPHFQRMPPEWDFHSPEQSADPALLLTPTLEGATAPAQAPGFRDWGINE